MKPNPEQDTDRAAFEKWAKTKDMPLNKIVTNLGKVAYKNWCVQDVYEAFQIAKADSRALQDAFEQVCEALEKVLRDPDKRAKGANRKNGL